MCGGDRLFGGEEKRTYIVYGSCVRREGAIKAAGVYVRRSDHFWNVEELIHGAQASRTELRGDGQH